MFMMVEPLIARNRLTDMPISSGTLNGMRALRYPATPVARSNPVCRDLMRGR
jgi:hypothetical protein